MSRKPWIVTPAYQGECRRTGNGASKLIWTLAMSSCGVIVAGGLTWLTSLTGKVDAHASTLATLTEGMKASDRRFVAIDGRLTRIEDKLDAVLDRRVESRK